MGDAGLRGAVWYWVRRELASRWRSLVVLGVLGALAGGVALAAFAGARRTDSVFERWRVATDAPDAIVFGTQIGLFDADYSPVLELPEVVDAGEFALAPVGMITADGTEIGTLAPADDHLYTTLARPVLSAGRLPDPSRTDEVLINEAAADAADLHVGSGVTIISSTDLDVFFGGGVHDGPELPATVVGITRSSAMETIFGGDEPVFIPTAAVLTEHPEIPRAPNLVVRLRPGTEVSEFHRRVVDVMGGPDIPVRDLGEDDKRITHGTDLERTGLLLFGVAALVAGLLLVGQAITRLVYGIAEASTPLRVLGMQRGHLVVGLSSPVLLSAAVTSLGALALATALSPLFPIGLGSNLEPDPGLAFDAWILIPGALLVGALVFAIGLMAAARATSQKPIRPRLESRIVRGIRSTAPLPVAIGAGLALDRGHGERSLPVRPALVGAVVGVIAVVGSFGLVRGIDDALDEPLRSGQIFDAEIFPSRRISLEDTVSAVMENPDVDAVAVQQRVPIDVGGAGLPVYAIEGRTGDTTFRLVSGRAPAAPDEAAIGPATANALDLGTGDELNVGGGDGTTVTVVGIALLPQTPHSSFDQGVWLTPSGRDELGEEILEATETTVAVSFSDGADDDAVVAAITEATGITDIEGVSLPQDVVLLRNVRNLPVALAIFLAFLGVAALGHVLVTAARRRRQDLAVLRALGFRPVQAGACLAWQATTVAIVGLVVGIPLGIVVGIPLGIVVGRLTWKWVADSTPLLYVPPLALVVVLLAIPATLLLANALALLPARSAARVRPAQVLRAE